jgi:hypothetical protein
MSNNNVLLGKARSTHKAGHLTTISELIKNGVFWDVTPCGSCKDRVSEELSASFIRVTRTSELGTPLAVIRNRRTLRRNTKFGISSYS